ncbi:MAG: cysteine desulfuration protein SufE, partial [Verrucomicrobiota bacterium]
SGEISRPFRMEEREKTRRLHRGAVGPCRTRLFLPLLPQPEERAGEEAGSFIGAASTSAVASATPLHAPLFSWHTSEVTLQRKQQQLVAELAGLDNTQARLAWLIERARERPLLPASQRVDAHRVEGCLSQLWFVPHFRKGHCWFQSESDSLFVKALAGLLCDFYSGHTPEEIATHDAAFLEKLGFSHHLTPHRRNTLGRVWDKIQDFARQHQTPTVR